MFSVGFTAGKTEDGNRSNWSGDARRPVAWSAWYPAKDNHEQPAAGLPATEPALFIADRITRDAALADDRQACPVVLLSHGTGGTAAGLGWLARRLAQRGYVVIGVDHHGNTATEPYRAEGFLCWWERARDLTVVLDHHATGPFAGRIDPDRLYAAGFSLGGYTALCLLGAITEMPLFMDWASGKPWGNGPREFPDIGEMIPALLKENPVFRASWERQSESCLDTRIKAAFLCAPAPTVRGLTIDSLKSITAPVSIASVGKDTEAPPDLCAQWLHDILPNSTSTMLDPAAGHYAFLCECTEWGKANVPELCADAPGVDRRLIHDKAAALAIDLFS